MTWVVPKVFLTSRIRTVAMLFLPGRGRSPKNRCRLLGGLSTYRRTVPYPPPARGLSATDHVSVTPKKSSPTFWQSAGQPATFPSSWLVWRSKVGMSSSFAVILRPRIADNLEGIDGRRKSRRVDDRAVDAADRRRGRAGVHVAQIVGGAGPRCPDRAAGAQ